MSEYVLVLVVVYKYFYFMENLFYIFLLNSQRQYYVSFLLLMFISHLRSMHGAGDEALLLQGTASEQSPDPYV